jgi:hypothetical protein
LLGASPPPPPPQVVYHTYISNYLCMNLKEVQWLNFSSELKFSTTVLPEEF